MLYSDQIFLEAYREKTEGLPYVISHGLSVMFPDRYLLEGEEYAFDLRPFAEARLCELRLSADVYSQLISSWSHHRGLQTDPTNAWFEVEWRGHTLEVILMQWGCERRQWVIAESRPIAENFFVEVCSFTDDVRGAVLVFDGGSWVSSKPLHEAIQGTTFENLVLEPSLKSSLMADIPRFFAAESTYKQHGVPWKRGLLLTGPPGNGKTHAIKALVNQSSKPCLYVKSFAGDNRDVVESGNMRSVFDRARQSAPCLLVLEDLDALINDENRSFFLNEMDGFAANEGVVTIASTNHPDRLDTAILNRPSRFDRKFVFGLPEVAERKNYLSRWNESWDSSLKLSEAGLDLAAEGTQGFSFATLKESMLSATMAWIETQVVGSMDRILAEQVAVMRAQNHKPTAQSEASTE